MVLGVHFHGTLSGIVLDTQAQTPFWLGVARMDLSAFVPILLSPFP